MILPLPLPLPLPLSLPLALPLPLPQTGVSVGPSVESAAAGTMARPLGKRAAAPAPAEQQLSKRATVLPTAPPPPSGLRMEVACCDADHEGEWDGEWEECEVVADHGDTCDVRIAEDKQLCRGVPRRLVRAQVAADPPGGAADPPGGNQAVLGFEGILTGTTGYGQATARSY